MPELLLTPASFLGFLRSVGRVLESEFHHPLLGTVWFDDGKADPATSSREDHSPQWICRPIGWKNGFEILLSGDSSGPSNLEHGLEALSYAFQIDLEGRRIAEGDVELNWIDLTQNPPSVGFPDREHIYVLWEGTLDHNWKIQTFVQGNW